LGDVLLLPGLVNAHTHLRLTHLKGKFGRSRDFVRWLGRIALRSKLSRRTTLQRAIVAGARELLEGGVTTAVEIDVDGLSTETLRSSPLRLVFAHECIGLDPAQAEPIASRLMEAVARVSTEPLRRRHGIAPHAPYSVSRELWEALAARLARKTLKPDGRPDSRVGQGGGTEVFRLPTFLSIHIAESMQEVEMFVLGEGKMVRWLRIFGALPRAWQAPRCSPVAFLEQTGILATAGIAVHCGCADDADIERLARCGWTVAFCPGTHEYFDRPRYPFERLRRAGVPVCVATDSAASNTGLSMMEEMRRLARLFPELPADEIVAAATTIPAQAIGWGRDIGRIEAGYCADLSAWSPCCKGNRLDRSWFEDEPPICTATVIAGRIIVQRVV
jgi:cytosine/adenosine deaminase-related metal-dependent hydrolase